MSTKPDTATPAKRTFRWGISSTDIDFMQHRELEGARDGSNCSDCSAISPLPRPTRAPADPVQDPK